jgi:hypothetical protein
VCLVFGSWDFGIWGFLIEEAATVSTGESERREGKGRELVVDAMDDLIRQLTLNLLV